MPKKDKKYPRHLHILVTNEQYELARGRKAFGRSEMIRNLLNKEIKRLKEERTYTMTDNTLKIHYENSGKAPGKHVQV